MTPAKPIVAIVLHYHSERETRRCIESLLASTLVPEVIVVDNASPEGLPEAFRARFPQISFLKNQKNLGFAGGMNTGLRSALERFPEASFYWLLNDDTLVEKDALEKLFQAGSASPERGLLSPAIYKEDGKTAWFLGGTISFLQMRTKHLTKPLAKEIFSSEYLTGCALLVSKKVIEKIGLLDERYFLYYEDAAYSLAAARAGFSLSLVRSARVYHTEMSRENPEKVYWLVRSGIRFFRTMSPWYFQPWISAFLLLRRTKNALTLLLSPSPVAREVRRAYTDASRDTYA